MSIISNIVEQHAEEAAFNWLLRDSAVSEPNFDLGDLAHLDDRIEANIDGLRIAGEWGWEICRKAMWIGEPGEIFTAGVLAFESQVAKRMDALLAAVEKDADLQSSLCSALGWIGLPKVFEPAQKLLDADLTFLKYIAVSVHAIQRQDPGAILAAYISDSDLRVRSRSLKAAGELGRLDLLPMVLDCVDEEDEKCRFYAAWSAVLLGDIAGIDKLKSIVEVQSPYAQKACELAVRKMDHGHALKWLNALGQNASTIRLATSGYGALGDPQAVPWLNELMQAPDLARPAGEALSMITGVDLAYEDLDTDAPEGFQAGPTEDPEDDDVEMDPDEDLPWPDPERIAAWWHEHQKDFHSGRRYLAGKPISTVDCRDVLLNGYQRQRAAAAIELALLEPGSPLFEVRAPGFRQQRALVQKK